LDPPVDRVVLSIDPLHQQILDVDQSGDDHGFSGNSGDLFPASEVRASSRSSTTSTPLSPTLNSDGAMESVSSAKSASHLR
jgi:hypothetical protein